MRGHQGRATTLSPGEESVPAQRPLHASAGSLEITLRAAQMGWAPLGAGNFPSRLCGLRDEPESRGEGGRMADCSVQPTRLQPPAQTALRTECPPHLGLPGPPTLSLRPEGGPGANCGATTFLARAGASSSRAGQASWPAFANKEAEARGEETQGPKAIRACNGIRT